MTEIVIAILASSGLWGVIQYLIQYLSLSILLPQAYPAVFLYTRPYIKGCAVFLSTYA